MSCTTPPSTRLSVRWGLRDRGPTGVWGVSGEREDPLEPRRDPRHGVHSPGHRLDSGDPDDTRGATGPGDRGFPPLSDRAEAAEERRLAALYGIGDPPPSDGGRNPFWWVWVFVVPFMLAAMVLMIWRITTAPDRTLPTL